MESTLDSDFQTLTSDNSLDQTPATGYIEYEKSLTYEAAMNNYIEKDIVKRSYTFTDDEVNFFVQTLDGSLATPIPKKKKAKSNEPNNFLTYVQDKKSHETKTSSKNLTDSNVLGTLGTEEKEQTTSTENSEGPDLKKAKKNKNTDHTKDTENLLASMRNEMQVKYKQLLHILDAQKREDMMGKSDCTTSYIASISRPARIKGQKATGSDDIRMPNVITTENFKKYEDKYINHELESFLNNELLLNFRKHYLKYAMEIMASKTLIFYGIGYKKNIVMDFSSNLSQLLQKQYGLHEKIPVVEIKGLDVPNRYNTLYNLFRNYIMINKAEYSYFESLLDKKDRPLWGDHALDEMSLLEEYYNHQKLLDPSTNKSNIKVILVIHNSDSEMFRKPSYKKFVAAIAKVPVISLIMTVDHIRFPFNYEKMLMKEINGSFHCVNTYKPMLREGYITQNDRDRFFSYFDVLNSDSAKLNKLAKRSSTIKGPSVYDKNSGLLAIFNTLTQHNLKIYAYLLQLLLERHEADGKSKQVKISSNAFLELCQKKLLINDKVNFDKIMKQFIDHCLCNEVIINRTGIRYLSTGYNEDEITYLLDNQLKDSKVFVSSKE